METQRKEQRFSRRNVRSVTFQRKAEATSRYVKLVPIPVVSVPAVLLQQLGLYTFQLGRTSLPSPSQPDAQ